MMFLWLVACSDYGVEEIKEGSEPLPQIQVVPDTLTFPVVPPDCIVEEVLTITNVGDGTLSVGPLAVDGGEFSVEKVSGDLAHGENMTARVRFSGPADGHYDGIVEVHSNDAAHEEVDVPLVGVVSQTTMATESFVQGSTAIDVIWVMDNSSSMAQEQARVAADITNFYSQFEALSLDYHMGVITTDVVNPVYSGQLVGEPRWIDPATPAGELELSEALNVGEDDMGNESGLLALEMALSSPVVDGYNAGFYRPEAALAVAFLSDEPEQSVDDAAHYISFLSALETAPKRLTISSIVGDRDLGCATTCDGIAEDAQAGNKYIDVTEAFGGVFASICTCDIGPALTQIGQDAVALVSTFTLSEDPVDDTVTVYVDGAESGDWTYDSGANTIVFSDPPEEGQNVAVTYTIETECPSDPEEVDTGSDTGGDTGGETGP